MKNSLVQTAIRLFLCRNFKSESRVGISGATPPPSKVYGEETGAGQMTKISRLDITLWELCLTEWTGGPKQNKSIHEMFFFVMFLKSLMNQPDWQASSFLSVDTLVQLSCLNDKCVLKQKKKQTKMIKWRKSAAELTGNNMFCVLKHSSACGDDLHVVSHS